MILTWMDEETKRLGLVRVKINIYAYLDHYLVLLSWALCQTFSWLASQLNFN